MDVALFVASGALSVSLPKCFLRYQTPAEQSSMSLALGLSLGLFSLSLLEATPETWFMVLSKQPRDSGDWSPTGILTISWAYWVLLWTLALVLLVVFPCLAGVAIGETLGYIFDSPSKSHNDRKYSFWKKMWRDSPWWIRFMFELVKILAKNLWKLVLVVLTIRRSTTEPVLAMAVNDDELRQVPSGDMELRSPTNSPKQTSHKSWMIAGSVAGVSIVLVLVSSVGPLVVHADSGKNALAVLISWLSAIGLLISSILNGFGSVSMPYTCLVGFYLKPVRKEVITSLEEELQRSLEMLTNKKAMLRELSVSVLPSSHSNNPTALGKFSKMKNFSDLGDEVSSRKYSLQAEIEFLEGLCRDMKEDIEQLVHSRTVAATARTRMGKIRSYAGLVFSAILLIRLASAGLTIWNSYGVENSKHKTLLHGDGITSALLWLTGHHYVSHEDFAMLSQVISLSLTAILSFTQIRFFLRTLAAMHLRLSRFYQRCYCVNPATNELDQPSATLPPTLDSRGFADIMAGASGCYFLSCIVLIKMMLPEEFCQSFASALGGMDVFTIHTPVVNMVYACSAGVSLAVLGMVFGIQRHNNTRHTSAAMHNGKVMRGGESCGV